MAGWSWETTWEVIILEDIPGEYDGEDIPEDITGEYDRKYIPEDILGENIEEVIIPDDNPEEVACGLEPTWLWDQEGEEESGKVAAGKEEAGKEEDNEPRLSSPRAWRMAGCNWAITDPTTCRGRWSGTAH